MSHTPSNLKLWLVSVHARASSMHICNGGMHVRECNGGMCVYECNGGMYALFYIYRSKSFHVITQLGV